MTTYAMKPTVMLCEGGEQAFLLSERPLLAIRVNMAGIALLRRIDCHTPAMAVTAAASLGSDDATSFLDALVRRGVLCCRPAPPAELPVVSVVVPVRNRAHEVRECLASLLSLHYPHDRLEIIVVDDASEDETAAVVQEMPVRLLRQRRQLGPAACRNAGALAARGSIIAYTDSDCVADPDWLATLVPYFGEPQVGAIGGLIEPHGEDSAIDRYEAVRSPLYMGREEGDVRPNSAIPYLPTANLLVRRHVWQQVGGFDEGFPIGEDVDLVWRLRDLGHRVRYVPGGRVRHKYRSTLRAYVSRRAFYGGSETLLMRKHRDKPKKLLVSWDKVASLALTVAALWTGLYLLAALGLILPALDLGRRAIRLRRLGAPVPFVWIARALARDYAGYFYHLFGNFARYYSIPLLLLGLLYWPLLIGGLLAMLFPVVHDFFSRRPRLGFSVFLALYWLELFAHQLGMLHRCRQCRVFGVLVPRLVFYGGICAP